MGADHLVGRANRLALMCLTERVSRNSLLITMPNGYAAADTFGGFVGAPRRAGPRSLAPMDHLRPGIGIGALVARYGLDIWFCDLTYPGICRRW